MWKGSRGEANERARSWLGAPSELEAVLRGQQRWRGAVHLRLLSPKFEHIPGKGDRDYVSRESAHRCRARARARASLVTARSSRDHPRAARRAE